MKKNLLILLVLFSVCVAGVWGYLMKTEKPFISLFPIERYDQKLSNWIKPNDPHYNALVLSKEKQNIRFEDFKRRYFGDRSPWDLSNIKNTISKISPNDVKSGIIKNLNKFNNEGKSGKELNYAENFRILPAEWIKNLESKCKLSQFDHIEVDAAHRAISVVHSYGRELPTDEVSYHHYTYAGEGYPFDNLQNALVWAGTPLYILGETEGKDWVLVQTPSFIAWLKSTDIARVDESFITRWRQGVSEELIAIMDTQISIIDEEGHQFWNSGFIGMVFPGKQEGSNWRIMIPVRDEHGQARIHSAALPLKQASSMPIVATPNQFVTVMEKLIGRPYGWGGTYFYNDCASELKNLFTPFGIWLPMHSSDQVNPNEFPLKVIDLTSESPEKRLDYLKNNGRPFMTILYVGGHVILYLGNYPNPNDPQHQSVVLSYQNVWSLKPTNPPAGKDRRSIIGGSVLLPILQKYPEDPGIDSDASCKYFTLGFLDAD